MNSYSFKFSPSLLDKFQNYLDSEVLYEKYYGLSDEPSMTFEQYEQEKFQSLIDSINRVPFESEAADKGSCLNEIVDCIVLGVKSTRDDISVSSKEYYVKREANGLVDPADGKVIGGDVEDYAVRLPHIEAVKGSHAFLFDIAFCKGVAGYFSGSLCQLYTEAPIETKHGKVLLYGYPDYVREDKVYDLKTTARYEFGKYAKYWQQHVYPYTLIESGKVSDVSAFEFTAYQMKGGTARSPLIYGEMYPEVYVYSHERSARLLRGICESFGDFLLHNKELITDTKIFGGEKKENNKK